jgi:hypothetical protein
MDASLLGRAGLIAASSLCQDAELLRLRQAAFSGLARNAGGRNCLENKEL